MDLSGTEDLLLSIHLTLSIWIAPELELSPAEAKRLADAASRVARHYPLVQSQKWLDWTQLAMALGTVYGPRGVAYWLRTSRPAPLPQAAPPYVPPGVMINPAAAPANGAQATPSAAMVGGILRPAPATTATATPRRPQPGEPVIPSQLDPGSMFDPGNA